MEDCRGQYPLSLLFEDEVEVFPSGFVDCLITDGGQDIQFFLTLVKRSYKSLVFQYTQLLQVYAHRMESIDGNAIIGAGVHPHMCHGGTVDR